MRETGWKGIDLAAAAEVTPTSVSRYLAAKAEPRSAELLRIARALGVSMEWLLAGVEPFASPPALRVAEDPPDYRFASRRVAEAAAAASTLAETLRGAEAQLDRLRDLLG